MSRGRPSPRRPSGSVSAKPFVAIVGRPNVGKSTLFNRLAGQHIAIVEDIPGVTRDRHYADAEVYGREYVLIDTGGFDPGGDDPMMAGIVEHVQLALEECDLVICVFDGTTPPVDADREAVRLLRETDKPVIFVSNKADSHKGDIAALTHYELGIKELLPISALHGRGVGDLDEKLAELLQEWASTDEANANPAEELDENASPIPSIAIVGRPNAGKSSLVNRLIGEDRQLVDDRPGTTVDSVDTLFEHDGKHKILIDTAGIRRKRSVGKTGVEALSVLQAVRAIERCDIAVLMIDAQRGVGEQDAKIAGLVVDRGRALVLGVNKIDLIDKNSHKEVLDRVRDVLSFVPWAPMVTLSATEGKGISALLGRVDDALVEYEKRIPTGELNRFFEEVLEHHPPPTMKNRPVRLYYVTQATTRPPTFVAMTNQPRSIHFSYQRYVVNQIRKRFGFRGTPIRVRYRGKTKKER